VGTNFFALAGSIFLCRRGPLSLLEAGTLLANHAAQFTDAEITGGNQWDS
jgi:hypothetical protein